MNDKRLNLSRHGEHGDTESTERNESENMIFSIFPRRKGRPA
jgi:hypothetical protein